MRSPTVDEWAEDFTRTMDAGQLREVTARWLADADPNARHIVGFAIDRLAAVTGDLSTVLRDLADDVDMIRGRAPETYTHLQPCEVCGGRGTIVDIPEDATSEDELSETTCTGCDGFRMELNPSSVDEDAVVAMAALRFLLDDMTVTADVESRVTDTIRVLGEWEIERHWPDD